MLGRSTMGLDLLSHTLLKSIQTGLVKPIQIFFIFFHFFLEVVFLCPFLPLVTPPAWGPLGYPSPKGPKRALQMLLQHFKRLYRTFKGFYYKKKFFKVLVVWWPFLAIFAHFEQLAHSRGIA